MIENNINPQPYQSVKECFDLVRNGAMTSDDLYLKANLIKFIKRFERENGSIVEFGSDITFETTLFVSLVIPLILLLLFGRSFCAWICPYSMFAEAGKGFHSCAAVHSCYNQAFGNGFWKQ